MIFKNSRLIFNMCDVSISIFISCKIKNNHRTVFYELKYFLDIFCLKCYKWLNKTKTAIVFFWATINSCKLFHAQVAKSMLLGMFSVLYV